MRIPGILLLVTTVLLSVISHISAKQPDTAARKYWIDSTYSSLTEEERIGQLFMVQAYSGGRNFNEDQVTNLINTYHIGSLIFMQGGAGRQAVLTNKYQHLSKVPLLIGMDAEWGLGMRLDSIKNLPRPMMLGATRDTALVYKVGTAIAAQCNRLKVNIDFAPDVDVNNNAANPVINSRSFGEDKTWVARLGVAFMRGLQNNGVIACAKHFPGHGDTNVDSHKDLPLIPKSLAQLDTLELYPFRQMIAHGVKSIMIAHLEIPALDTTPHQPTTLSRNVVTGQLKNRLGFEGLIFTDAMDMKGLTKYYSGGDAELKAFEAGNDIIMFATDVPAAIAKIKNAVDTSAALQASLETSVRKILAAKYDAGLYNWTDIDPTNITDDINSAIEPIRKLVAKAAMTVVKDENQILNKINENMRIGYVGVNANRTTPLYEALLDKFNIVDAMWLPKGVSADTMQKDLEALDKYDAVVVGIHSLNFTPGNNYGLTDEQLAFLQTAGCRNNTMMVLLGNAYVQQYFCGAGSVMVGYEDDTISENTVADILFRKMKAKGKLPVTACIGGHSVCPMPAMPTAVVKESGIVLKKTLYPTDAGVVNQTALSRLDMFIARDIADGVFPGCRVLAAKNGKVFYDKAFGYLRYDKKKAVDTNTLYDMASCTKVLATTLAVMKLYEQGKLDLNKTIADYLPQAHGTNKANIKVRDLLLHQAGLKAIIPFFRQSLDDDGKLDKTIYSNTSHGNFTVAVARDLYIRKDYIDTMWSRIYSSSLDNLGKSVYSDLDFYFLAAIVQQISGKRIDKYADEQFYKPMGLKRITYLPLTKFDTTDIAPTETDLFFRKQTLVGYVHDPGAAMLGGVAGHAGVFASADDVAAIFQMLLNKGMYGNTRYFKASTVDLFSSYQSSINHRGLGFDKPTNDPDNGGPAGDRCSGLAFGHQGFTGTCAWADPATGIVFVLLSNRVYPSAENTKINKLDVRTTSQDYIYEALGVPVDHTRPEVYKSEISGK